MKKFERILQVEDIKNDNELRVFIENEIDSCKQAIKEGAELDKKANDNLLVNLIYDHLNNSGEHHTILDLKNTLPELADLTNQKIAVLLNKLVKAGNVEKDKNDDKKTVYFVKGE